MVAVWEEKSWSQSPNCQLSLSGPNSEESGRIASLLRASCFLQPNPILTVIKTEILGQIDDQRQVFFINAVEFRGNFSGNCRPNRGPNGGLAGPDKVQSLISNI
jgi:hypothetical protein